MDLGIAWLIDSKICFLINMISIIQVNRRDYQKQAIAPFYFITNQFFKGF